MPVTCLQQRSKRKSNAQNMYENGSTDFDDDGDDDCSLFTYVENR